MLCGTVYCSTHRHRRKWLARSIVARTVLEALHVQGRQVELHTVGPLLTAGRAETLPKHAESPPLHVCENIGADKGFSSLRSFHIKPCGLVIRILKLLKKHTVPPKDSFAGLHVRYVNREGRGQNNPLITLPTTRIVEPKPGVTHGSRTCAVPTNRGQEEWDIAKCSCTLRS